MAKKAQEKQHLREETIENGCQEYDDEVETENCEYNFQSSDSKLQNSGTELQDKCHKDCECTKVVFSVGDAVFASVVVAPLVVVNWRGTWGLMDIHHHYFPYAQSFVLGMIIHICFTLIRSNLFARSTGAWSDGAGRWLYERVVCRIYTYVFILSCLMHWRGGWGLFDQLIHTILPDENDPHRPYLIMSLVVIMYACLVALRSARNLLAPPYFLVTDGKEPTYTYTTRFKQTEAGGPACRRILAPLADMRGSTAGLTDTLGAGSRAHAALLAAADALFASLVVAPAVVAYWKSTWSLMDIYVLPEDSALSAGFCAVFGLSFTLVACIFQNFFVQQLDPNKGRLTFYVCSRLFTSLGAVACVASWRGVWNLLNESMGDDARTILATTAAAMLALAALRGLRNIMASPFAVFLDSPNDYFEVPTMFRTTPVISVKNSRETVLFVLDCIFSVVIVGSLVILLWRGLWALLDIYLYPEDQAKSFFISLVVGYSLVAITFSLQVPLRWAVARLHGAPRLLLVDSYHLFSFMATVNLWRAIWGLLDVYLFPDSPKLSNWLSHGVSLTLLILLNCSNSILVRGVYIDAEEPAGECVVFPCHYLRLFFHRERTKKRHRRALAAAAAATVKFSEDPALAPLQLAIVQEKV